MYIFCNVFSKIRRLKPCTVATGVLLESGAKALTKANQSRDEQLIRQILDAFAAFGHGAK